MHVHAQLSAGLRGLGLACDAATEARLLAYLGLLVKWNRVYNLTAVREPGEMVTKHLLDSLAVLPFVRGPRVLDIGTGAGLPGIPLALMRPDCHVVLLDSNAKKTRFVQQAVAELGLTNAEVAHARVQEYHPGPGFDTVVSRAYASLAAMCEQAGRLCAPNGVLLAMKGERPEGELRDLPAGCAVQAVQALQVPGLAAERHVVVIVPNT